jgi:hypothetical protein
MSLTTFQGLRRPPRVTPFCNATRCLTLSIDPDVDGCRFRKAKSGSERGDGQCGEHCSGILIDDSEQSASRRFWRPPPSLPVLDGVEAEPKPVREFGLCHAQVDFGSLSRQLPGAHVP